MILDNLFKNLIYDPVSVLGLLVFYVLLINLPISLFAVFKKHSSLTVKKDLFLKTATNDIGKLTNKK